MVSSISSEFGSIQSSSFMIQNNSVMDSLRSTMDEKLAEKTGLSVEELQTAQKNGTFMQVLDNAGITKDDMNNIRTEALDEMVSTGEITQDQADKITKQMSAPPPPPPGGSGKTSSEDEDLISWIKKLSETEDEETVKSMLQNLISQKTQNGDTDISGMLLDYFQ